MIDVEGFTYARLVQALKSARGWFRTIERDTGCSRSTLRRMANEPDYDPRISEVNKVAGWFRKNGIPTRHPLAGPRNGQAQRVAS